MPETPVGFDPDFLLAAVPFPLAPATTPTRELRFTHFTVLLQPARRLALATGVNLDGAQLVEIDRGNAWHLDPRVPADQQTGPEVYVRNDLDRGHLVRRRDPVWGSTETAVQANLDTFNFVNAAPQAGVFNQGKALWAGLENYVLEHAQLNQQRLSVFTAPVLDPDDPPYRGVQIPRLFWKIAAWAELPDASEGAVGAVELAATGYVLDQTPQLDDIDLASRRAREAGRPPPLGPFRTFQVPISDIAALTGLDLGPLLAADRLSVPTPTPSRSIRWTELGVLDDIRL